MIDELAAAAENVIAVHHDQNRGIEAGWSSGLEASSGSLICLIDSDLQYVPEDVWRLYREYLASPDDMIQGYRSSVGRDGRDPRYGLSRGLNVMLNLLFGMRLARQQVGIRALPPRGARPTPSTTGAATATSRPSSRSPRPRRATPSGRSRCSSIRGCWGPRSSRVSP